MKQKYYVELNRQEWRLIIEGLNRFRNKLIAAGRYTDAVDEILMLYSQLHAKCGFLRKADDDAIVRHYIDELHIKTPSAMQAVGNLSGGNQQKVVVSKWLSISPRILLLDEPTQGIDVGAKADIYQLIDRLAREGMGVIVVSSDLIEIINLSNRIVVMRDGQAIKTLESDELTEENVMLYAMGVNADEKA